MDQQRLKLADFVAKVGSCSDLWECIEIWPWKAKQEAVDLLLPMVAARADGGEAASTRHAAVDRLGGQ
jgi:hypothetical protein